MIKQILLFAVLCCLLHANGNAQSPGTESQALTPNPETNPVVQKKGSFFITPFYEFTQFKNLKLTEHTNYYSLAEGESQSDFTQEVIDEYNDNYGTEYRNSMAGIKIGYQVLDGLGISGYIGVNHFDFKSWISAENTQTLTTNNPALTLGLTVDYQKVITNRFIGLAMLSSNYCTTGSVVVVNNTGLDVVSSSSESMYWDANLALAYRAGKFVPYAGAGFTQQFVHPVTSEETHTTNDNGEPWINTTKFDSHYTGSSVYGFAGVEYRIDKNVSAYGRCTFVNPVRATLGFRIVL